MFNLEWLRGNDPTTGSSSSSSILGHHFEQGVVFPDGTVMWIRDEDSLAPSNQRDSFAGSLHPSNNPGVKEVPKDRNPSNQARRQDHVHYHYYDFGSGPWLFLGLQVSLAIALMLILTPDPQAPAEVAPVDSFASSTTPAYLIGILY